MERDAATTNLVLEMLSIETSLLLQRLEQSEWSVFRRDLVPRMDNFTFAINQECRTLNSHVLTTVHGFLLPDLVFLCYRIGVVGKQRETE